MQIAHLAGALHLRQIGHAFGQRDLVREFAIEGVIGQIDIGHAADLAHGAARAVGSGVGTEVGNLVAVGQRLAVGGFVDIQAGDADLIEREQFARLRDAVLIQIAPYAQLAPVCIGAVDLAVAVGVFLRQRGKTVGGLAACVQWGGVAEQFGAVVDGGVAVAVHDQEAVIGFDPAGAGFEAVAVVVEQDGIGGRGGDGFEAVVVQVEG